MPRISHSFAPGCRVFTMTFLSVSAAVKVRPRSVFVFRYSTSVAMVGVPGV